LNTPETTPTSIPTNSATAPYQEVAAKARAHLEGLADLYVTPAREAELVVIFKEATRLEADFWEMGWRAGQRVE
jgi:thiaminase (transcriptional activator TenA)